jgi:hypothetical protein
MLIFYVLTLLDVQNVVLVNKCPAFQQMHLLLKYFMNPFGNRKLEIADCLGLSL